MKNKRYESLLDAFRDLNDVSDEEVLTPKTEKLIREGKEFSLRATSDELEAAREALDEADAEEEIEVIDINADTLEHIKDKKEYVGQAILQCAKCHANKFIDMDKLVADELDPELYNVEDECPNCHSEGEGFELVGQVGKVAEETEEAAEPVSVDNDEFPEDGAATFENDHQEEDGADGDINKTFGVDDFDEEPDANDDDEELDAPVEQIDDGMTTSYREDEDDEEDEGQLGDVFDPDKVRPDDTEEPSDDDEDDTEEEVVEEEDDEEDDRPVKRKLKLPTREYLRKVRGARVSLVEELVNRVALPESIRRIIVTDNKNKKLYEGAYDKVPEELLIDSKLDGFDVANGFLMLNVEPATEDVTTPLAQVLNVFTDDDTTKICVWDADTSEELFQGSKKEALRRFGHCQLVSLDAPRTLRLTIKSEEKCDCEEGVECICNKPAIDDENATPEDALLDNIFKANDLAKYNSDDNRSEEYWVKEAIYNKEDLEFVYERYIKGLSDRLVEQFKQVTGFKDDVDKFAEEHNVMISSPHVVEALTKSEFDEMMSLATEAGIKTVADLQAFSKEMGDAKDQDLLDALRQAVAVKDEPLKENYRSFKTRRSLSEALAKVKQADVSYKIRRSVKEGYRYDIVFKEDYPGAYIGDDSVEDYNTFVADMLNDIKKYSLDEAEDAYFNELLFDERDPADENEEKIKAALTARIKQLTGKTPEEMAEEEYLGNAKDYAAEILTMGLEKVEELYYDEYNFDTSEPKDEAEQIIFDALVSRIEELSDEKPVIAGEAVLEDFELVEEADDVDQEYAELLSAKYNENLEELVLEAHLRDDDIEEDAVEDVEDVEPDADADVDVVEIEPAEEAEEEEVVDEEEELEDLEPPVFDENTGDDLQDNIALLSNDELEAIASYEEVIAFFEKKGVAKDGIIDSLKEMQEDEEEHLQDLKDLFYAATGEDLAEVDQDDEDIEDVVDDEADEEDETGAPIVEDGNSVGMEIADIAELHGVDIEEIEKQIKKGIEIEMEHTDDERISKIIAMDHLVEFPDYYDRLIAMEKEAKEVLEEGVHPDNPFLKSAIEKLKAVPKAKGVVVSFRKPQGKEEEVGIVYYNAKDLFDLEKDLKAENGNDIDISAIHDREMLPDYEQAINEDLEEEYFSEELYSKNLLLDAVMTAYGFTKKEAEDFIKTAPEGIKRALIKGFKQDAKNNFYEEVEKRDIDFDTELFDKEINEYFNEAYESRVEYKTKEGYIDANGYIMLEGLLDSEEGKTPITFALVPHEDLKEDLKDVDYKEALSEKIKNTTYTVKNSLSEEVFTFSYEEEK